MVQPDELDFVAQLIGLFTVVVAGILLAANQDSASAWASLVGGGVLMGGVQLYASYLRLLD